MRFGERFAESVGINLNLRNTIIDSSSMASFPPTPPNPNSNPPASSSSSEDQVGRRASRSSSAAISPVAASAPLESRHVQQVQDVIAVIPNALQKYFGEQTSMTLNSLTRVLKTPNRYGTTPVHLLAISENDLGVFGKFLVSLIQKGQDITLIIESLALALKTPNQEGSTPGGRLVAGLDSVARVPVFGKFLVSLIQEGQDITPIIESLALDLKTPDQDGNTFAHWFAYRRDDLGVFSKFLVSLIQEGQDITSIIKSLAVALKTPDQNGETPVHLLVLNEDDLRIFGEFLVNLIQGGQDIIPIIESLALALKAPDRNRKKPIYELLIKRDRVTAFKEVFQVMIEVANAQQDRLLVIWIGNTLQQIIDNPDFPREFRQDLYEFMDSILKPLLTSFLSQNLQNLENIAGYTEIPVEILDLIASSTPSLSFPEEEDSRQELA